MQCRPGAAAQENDTTNPAQHRWTCAHGSVTKECTADAPPPECRADQVYVLGSDGELACGCPVGEHEHGKACVDDPVCGAAEMQCRPGAAAQENDTTNPAQHRWTCAHGSVTKECTADAPPPECRADQVYVLADGELACGCPVGEHEDGKACVDDPVCGAAEMQCRPGAAAQENDTTNPAQHRWTCAHGSVTKECTADAPPPECRADQVYVLADGELACGCPVGEHEDGKACVDDPVCGNAEPICTTGMAAGKADTLQPAQHRWTCAHGSVTKECTADAPPPECRADQVYVLADGELACGCPVGEHEDGKACVDDPVCGAAEMQCRPGAAAQENDTTNPAQHRWTCAHGSVTKECTADAPPPECRADQVYVLGSDGELACGCPVGEHEDGKACVDDPVCGNAEPICTTGMAAGKADTLQPAQHRWTCAHGSVTKECTADAPPPECRADQVYVLGSDGELACGCPVGEHEDGKACVDDPVCGAAGDAVPARGGGPGERHDESGAAPVDMRPRQRDEGVHRRRAAAGVPGGPGVRAGVGRRAGLRVPGRGARARKGLRRRSGVRDAQMCRHMCAMVR